MRQTLALVFITVTVLQTTVLAVPFTYCFSGGELCCEGYSGDICCPSTSTPPGLGSCCSGSTVLVSRNATSPSQVRTGVAQPEQSAVSYAPSFWITSSIPGLSPLPSASPPHLSSVVLRI